MESTITAITIKTLSLTAINNSNILVDPWALALHTRRITSTNTGTIKLVGWNQSESESCECLSYHSPSIGIGDADGSRSCHWLAGSFIVLTQDKQAVPAAVPIVRKGSTFAESLVTLTPARPCVNPVNSIASTLSDWFCVGLYTVHCKSEWAQPDHSHSVPSNYMREDSETNIPRAFTWDDITFHTSRRQPLSTDLVLALPDDSVMDTVG
jgi:hypothetical protein